VNWSICATLNVDKSKHNNGQSCHRRQAGLLTLLCIHVCTQLDHSTTTAFKRQIPFLIGGTITGIIMTYFVGFPITILVNSIIWYFISHIVYGLVWRRSGLSDQKILLKYFLTKVKTQKHSRTVE